MRRSMHDNRRTLAAAAMLLGVVSPQSPVVSPPPKPMVPVAASSVAADPAAYYGQYVTLMAVVDQRFSRSAFSVDQDRTRSTGHDVLILAPTLSGAVDLNTYVTVLGEVVRFDPDEIARKAKDYTLDLAPDVVARYRGRPAVLATAVINGAMVDLAKRLPPPMTAEEEAYSKVMKRIGPAFAALRQAVAASNSGDAGQNAGVLKQGFGETEAFWKSRGKVDATTWAQDARKQAEAVERAAAAGKWEDATTSAGTLAKSCQTCHAAYRERFDDGSYRIKGAAK
jgi:hypothetical protein